MSEETGSTTVRLEGRVAGPWVGECDRAFRSLATSLGPKKLRIDLRHVTFMDAKGQSLLTEVYRQTRADFLADTPMTKHFVEEARRGSQNDTKREA